MASQAQRATTTRQAILAAATHIISNKGYSHCSIAAIANETAFTTGAIQHHFKSKGDLLFAVVTEHIFLSHTAPPVAAIARGSIDQRCQQIVAAMWSYYGHPHYAVVWEIILCNRNNASLLAEINRFFQAAERKAANDIRMVFADVELTAEQSAEISLLIGAHLRGIALLRFTNPTAPAVNEQPKFVAKLCAVHIKQSTLESPSISTHGETPSKHG